MTAATLTRAFRLGATTLPDPDPQMPPEEVVKLLQRNNPAMPPCHLGDSSLEGDTMVYALEKAPAKTKG